MKRVFLGLLGSAVFAAHVAFAQLVTLPASTPASMDLYGNRALWDMLLTEFPLSSDGNRSIDDIAAGSGTSMGGTVPTAVSDLIAIRVIYFGETSSRALNFGFTRGAPTTDGSGNFTANVSARTLGTLGSAPLVPFAFWDVLLTAATFSSFDLWVNVPGAGGGLVHAFHPAWGTGSVAWSQSFALATAYFDTTSSTVVTVPRTTYFLGFEDGLDSGAPDHSDVVLGIQFIREGGGPGIVPEPASYGLVGAGLCGVILALRRRFAAQSTNHKA